jgi:splicing factor 3A subunit 3
VDYVAYLSVFDRLFDLPREKKNAEYRIYLQSLVDYLVEYVARVKPLMDIDNLFHQIEQDFEKDFAAGTFPGWPVNCHFLTAQKRLVLKFKYLLTTERDN